MKVYHGTTGRHFRHFAIQKKLYPAVGDGRMWGPYSLEAVGRLDFLLQDGWNYQGWGVSSANKYHQYSAYVSDTYALSWALERHRNPETLILLELDLPQWVFKCPVSGGAMCLAGPDPTFHLLQAFGHLPTCTWKDLPQVAADLYQHVPTELGSHSWEESYERFGSFSILLGRDNAKLSQTVEPVKLDSSLSLPISRMLYARREDIDPALLLSWMNIEPMIDEPEEVKETLRQLHRDLLDSPPNGFELYDWR